jgi:predicted dehydrogenase
MPASEKHGVLVIGAGSIGARHARNLRTIGVKYIAICDPDAERRSSIAHELSCDDFSTIEQALQDDRISTVAVCSPTKFHIPQAIAVAVHGKHLFIEKPLSHAADGLDDLQRMVKQNHLTCMIGCNMRFHFGPATVKRLLEEGKIGKPVHAKIYTGSYLPDWRPKTDFRESYSADPMQGGAILDCIHEIDLAQWYLGSAELMECALKQADPLGIPVEGTADLKLHHASGATSDVHLSFMEKEYKRYCFIEGTEGSLFWDFHRKTVEVKDAAGQVQESVLEPEGYDINQMYIDELKYFLGCSASGTVPMGNLTEATSVLSIALQARKNINH